MEYCKTCLSFGRELYPLGDYTEVLEKLLGDSYGLYTYNILRICWECLAALKRIVQFQKKVIKASNLLQKNIYTTLSTLTVIKLTNVINMKIEGSTEVATDFKQETTLDKGVEMKEEDNFEDHYNNSELIEYNLQENIIKKEKNSEGVEKKRSHKWIQRKIIQNKKPKFKILTSTEFNPKEFIKKVAIDPAELTDLILKERESEYFKRTHYKCVDCLVGFENEKLLVEHKMKEHELGDYECDTCKTKMSQKLNLSKHCIGHFFMHKCNICQFSCWSRGGLIWHIKKTHRKVYECVKCELKFTRKEFFVHYKEWHENFICDQCGVSFKMRYCIKQHIRKQHSPFTCRLCDKSFLRPNALWLHNKLKHTPLEGAYCVECDKHFACAYAYKWHLSSSVKHIVPKVVSIPCPECDKKFSKKTNMKDHYNLVHLKVYKNRCDECNKNFLRNADLAKHKRVVHQGIPPPKNKICYICGRGFTHNKILKNHIRTHTGERPFACDRCPKKFAQSSALVCHKRSVHKDR